MKHDEPIREVSVEKKCAMDWLIFKNNQYVLFLIVALVFNFGWQMAWGLFNIYNIRYAQANREEKMSCNRVAIQLAMHTFNWNV